MKNVCLLLICVLWIGHLDAQDFSNKGKDFWLGYGYHVSMAGNPSNGGAQNMVLYFTSDKNATVTVDLPGVAGFTPQTYTVIANQVTSSNPLPKTGTTDCRINTAGLSNKGIHITSSEAIVAYAHIYDASVSGASLLFPTTTLGKDYYSVNYTQSSNASNANSFFFVVATEDGTNVEITPSAANINGLTPNVASAPISLNKGQVYCVMGTVTGTQGTDLTGSRIRSTSANGSGGCKKIAVFSGSGKMSIGGTANGSADNLFAQAFPAVAWGKKYLTAPTGVNGTPSTIIGQPNNYYRICVTDPKTVVKLNGSVLPASSLINNFYYQFKNGNASGSNPPVPNLIESDIPVLVAQYCTTYGQDGNTNTSSPWGDPEMIYLSPVEQTINKITLYSATKNLILQSYINVIIKNGGVNSFTLDGASKKASFLPHPQDANYSYAVIPVSSGSHNLYSDSGFNAIAYGFGSAESYGYNAGTNVKDFTQTASFYNPYKRLDSAISCVNTNFQFSIPLNFIPSTIKWDFSTAPNITPNAQLSPAVAYDSSSAINGQVLYYFSPKQTYKFTQTNTAALRDTIKLYTTSTTPDGCGSTEQIYTIPVKVTDLPSANFTTSNSGCVTDSIHFFDATITHSESVIDYGIWDWGDGTKDSSLNPVKKYAAAGNYNVHYHPVSSYGCTSDTTIGVVLSAQPVANFNIGDSCVNQTIGFSDLSTSATNPIAKWYWDYGDGRKDTLTTNSPFSKTYSQTGNFIIKLMVETNTGCQSPVFSKSINIHPKPIPNFSLPIVCLPAGIAKFNDSTTIAETASLKYAWDFGDGKGVDSVANPSYAYGSTGPFTVSLKVTSAYGCFQSITKNLITIYALAKAGFTVNPENCLRDSTRFTDQSNGSGNVVTQWRWDFGDGSSDTLQNPVYRYPAIGTKSVSLFVITDKGCNSDTIKQSLLINPLPTALFDMVSPLCEKRSIAIVNKSVANAGTLNRWNWDFGDGSTKETTSAAGFTKQFGAWGKYNIRLLVETDKGCKSDTLISIAKINPLPQVGFVLPEVCVSDGAATFTDTSKIADGTQAQFSWNWKIAKGTTTNAQPSFINANVQHAKILVNKADYYMTQLRVTSVDGCLDSLTQQLTVNGPTPKASFAVQNASGLCSNDSIRIVNTSTVDFGYLTRLDIIWDLANAPLVKTPDESPVDKQVYSKKYSNFYSPATVAYNVKLVAFSGTSSTCQNAVTQTVVINRSPSLIFVKPKNVCNDASAALITPQASAVSSVPGTPNYIGVGITDAVKGTFDPKVSGVGTFTIKYRQITDMGCRDSISQPITVWPSPIAKWGVASPLCEKNNLNFSDSSIPQFGKIVSRIWDFNDGFKQTNTDSLPFTHQFATGNMYNVKLKVVTDSGCVSPDNIQSIKVNYLPLIDFSLPSICLPDGRGSFTGNSTIPDGSQDLFSFLWNFNDPFDPSSSTIKSPTHRFSALGPYNIQLKITTKDGCIDSLTRSLSTIYPQPKADFATVPDQICLGDQIQFNDLGNGISSAAKSWVWDLSGGNSSVIQNPIKKFTDSGNFSIVYYFFNGQGCVSDTVTKMVTVHPYPKLVMGPNLKVLDGGTIPIVPKFVWGNNLSYLWTPASYLNSDTASRPLSTPPDDITYQLTLTGIGSCSVSDTIFIKVLKSPLVPNAFSPNGDGINDTWKIQYLESYPGATVDVYNRYGQKVFSSVGYDTEWDGTYNGNALPIGTYYWIINPKNGRAMINGSVTIVK